MIKTRELVGTENAGFTITKQGHDTVIGYRELECDFRPLGEYVVWNYHIMKNGKPSYYTGNYTDEKNSEKVYNKRENR